jgi:hypothetical protein
VVAAIGIDKYRDWPKLRNAVSDAEGVLTLCKQIGFIEALPLLKDADATGPKINELIDRLDEELTGEDHLLLFFAGHGHTHVEQTSEGPVETGYLIPVEARTDQPGDYVRIETFLQAISALQARHILVVLDSCRSGFALGRAVQLWPSTEEGGSDPAKRRSRRVITSAGKDQAAEDSGPVKRHSVFTGMLLQGLDWGTADLTGNGEVTTSELGVFLAHRVPQASRYGDQVPDFGAFEGDERVDMTISLQAGSYHELKIRALATLQQGLLWGPEGEGFCWLVDQLKAENPDSSWTRFLEYRRALLEGDVSKASVCVDGLRGREDVARGMLPVSEDHLMTLGQQLEYFRTILEWPETPICDFPLKVRLEADSSWMDLLQKEYLAEPAYVPPPRLFGNLQGYELPLSSGAQGSFARFSVKVKDQGYGLQHIYFLVIRPDGRLVLGPLLRDPRLALGGVEPREVWARGMPFEVANVGLTETRILCSPKPIPSLLLPPTTATRDVISQPYGSELDGLCRQTIWYRVRPADDERWRLDSLRKV